jgi:tetratricopeptide (TPR) repeat protein
VTTVAEVFALALRHHEAGNLIEAERIYLRILQTDPRHADSHHLLGVLAYQVGRFDFAVASIRNALDVNKGIGAYHSNLGLALEALGLTEEAVASYERAVSLQPDLVAAHANLGNASVRRGKPLEALPHYQRALRYLPNYPEAHCGMGLAYASLGKPDQAVSHYYLALGLNPNYAEAHNNLANVLLDQGKLVEAAEHCGHALRVRPAFVEAHTCFGNVLLKQDKPALALGHFVEALRIRPGYIAALNGMGNALLRQDRFEEAVAHYQHAIRIQPDFVEALIGLGSAFRGLDRFGEAVNCFRLALRINPHCAETCNNLASVLVRQDLVEEGIAWFQTALKLKPNFASAYYNLGNAFERQMKLEDAIGCYEHALRLQAYHEEPCTERESVSALAHWNRALLMLLIGDFERGWKEYEWRWAQTGVTRRVFSQPAWDGSPLGGRRILLYAEQGLGDTVQFIRFVSLVKERGGTVIVECQPELTKLLANASGVECLVKRGSPLPPFDFQAPLLSLPGIFQTDSASVPAAIPYLHADSKLVNHWRQELAVSEVSIPKSNVNDHSVDIGRRTSKSRWLFRVGIAWQGSPTFPRDQQRSIPLAHFGRLGEVENVQLISLQKGPGACQPKGLKDRFAVRDLGNHFDETSGPFMDTAAVMMNLDLVISSDTAIPHVAGALGVPVWVALPLVPDWRWLLGRDDSPWYPTMRLFRQTAYGQWDDVFERMATELENLIAACPT